MTVQDVIVEYLIQSHFEYTDAHLDHMERTRQAMELKISHGIIFISYSIVREEEFASIVHLVTLL